MSDDSHQVEVMRRMRAEMLRLVQELSEAQRVADVYRSAGLVALDRAKKAEADNAALRATMPSEDERAAIHECIDAVRDSGIVGDQVHVAARAVNRLSPPSAPAHGGDDA